MGLQLANDNDGAPRLVLRATNRAANVRERIPAVLSMEFPWAGVPPNPMKGRSLTRAARFGMRTANSSATAGADSQGAEIR